MWLFWCVYCFSSVTISVTDPDNDAYDKELTLQNNAPFVSCISKTNNTLFDNAEDLDIVISMCNLLKCSKNCKKQQEVFGIITEMNQIAVYVVKITT